MKKTLRWIVWSALLVTALPAVALTVKSPGALGADGHLKAQYAFNGMGCTGQNISPEVSWSGAPKGTRSFVVTVYDESAVSLTKSGWWHWVAYDIPASTHALARGAGRISRTGHARGFREALTDFGFRGYGGPCPPVGNGVHRYVVTVYALNIPALPLPATAGGAMTTFMARAHALAAAHMVWEYGR